MFFKCISCNQRKPISYTEIVPTMSGDVKLRYCSECATIKVEEKANKERQYKIQADIEQKEREKEARYRYLKREVELVELEEKAKQMGIL